MEETRNKSQFAPFTPGASGVNELEIPRPEWRSRRFRMSDLGSLFAILAGVLTLVAWVDQRVANVEHRVDAIEKQMELTNYILCVNARRNDPASAPPRCSIVLSKEAP